MQRVAISLLLCPMFLLPCGSVQADDGAPAKPPAPAPAPDPTPAAAASASGDYIGDCFSFANPAAVGLTKSNYFVSAQENLASSDRNLTLLEAEWKSWQLTCKPSGASGAMPDVRAASKLIAAGATRTGWTYGALTMPYKYYPGTKTFSVNAPIGAYVGLRRGIAGSGHTYALAFTLSSVKADTVDPKALVDGKPSVTGTTDVAALSLAAGMMFDILKSPAGKPFKAGFFVGVDRVSRSPTVSYAQNGKAWVALQLGYDFTDN